MRFRLIEAEKAQHPVSLLCGVLGVTMAGYYAWRRREPCRRKLEDERLAELIGGIFEQSEQTYGAPRIHAELADDFVLRVGKKRVARLMRTLGVEASLVAVNAGTHDLKADLVVDALGMR